MPPPKPKKGAAPKKPPTQAQLDARKRMQEGAAKARAEAKEGNLGAVRPPTPAHVGSQTFTAEQMAAISASLEALGIEANVVEKAFAHNQVVRDRAIDIEPGLTADAGVLDTNEFRSTLPEAVAAEDIDWDSLSAEAHAEAIRRLKFRPIGSMQQKLALPKKPHYHRHWFNDSAGRIGDALASGWRHVKDDEGRPIRRVVGSDRAGAPMGGYAMEIPEIIFLEDMARRHAAAAEKMNAIKRQPFQAPRGAARASDRGKFYDPVESEEGPIRMRTPSAEP